jgi:hypothetical protein
MSLRSRRLRRVDVERESARNAGDDSGVPAIQSAERIQERLERLSGREIAGIQVFGINSLKSLLPMREAITDEVVTAAEIADRIVAVRTASHSIAFDLQRTGRLI